MCGSGIKIFGNYDPAGAHILIDRNDHDQEPDTKARDPTASPEVVQILRAGLQGPTDEVDYTSNNDSYQSS